MPHDSDAPPQDISAMDTEGINPTTTDIDCLTPLEIVRAINAEDAKVAAAVEQELPQIASAIEQIAARLRRGGRLIYVGAGTSGRLGVLDASECPPTFGVPPDVVVGWMAGGPGAVTQAVEEVEDSEDAGRTDVERLGVSAADVLVGIAASGRTPYVLGAVAQARGHGALTIGLACNRGTPLAERVAVMIAPVVGPEVIAGSTRLKAGTAQKLVLNMISTITMIRLGKTYGNLMVDVRASNEKLRARSRRIVALATGAQDKEIEDALTATDGEVKNAILVLLGAVDGPTAAALLDEARGHLRVALRAAAARTP